MHLFQRRLSLQDAWLREANEHDITAISHLMRISKQRYTGMLSFNLSVALGILPSQLLIVDDQIVGVLIAGRPHKNVAWLQVLAFSPQIDVSDALCLMLPAFHKLLLQHEISKIYFTGDEMLDQWVLAQLKDCGYVFDTNVVMFEKQDMHIPSFGNTSIWIRPAQVRDLAAITAIDDACFDAQWYKGELILGPVLLESHHFVVAQIDEKIVGFVFVTSHAAGKLIHLVRIAVLPEYRGQAIGVRLLADIVAYAASVGAYTISLNTQEYNHSAQQLYTWFGFKQTLEKQIVLRYDIHDVA
jgi:ribosomal-protein-alanine N-acetyltransferase